MDQNKEETSMRIVELQNVNTQLGILEREIALGKEYKNLTTEREEALGREIQTLLYRKAELEGSK